MTIREKLNQEAARLKSQAETAFTARARGKLDGFYTAVGIVEKALELSDVGALRRSAHRMLEEAQLTNDIDCAEDAEVLASLANKLEGLPK